MHMMARCSGAVIAVSVVAAVPAALVAVIGRDWPWRGGMFAAIAVGVMVAMLMTRPPPRLSEPSS